MTPEQMLARIRPPLVPEVIDAEVEVIDMREQPIAVIGAHYTSETMEEDFSDAVELLMVSMAHLRMVKDIEKHYSMMGEKAQEAFDEHLAAVEEFCGMWEND